MCRHSARTLGEIIRCLTNRKIVMCCDQDAPRGCGCVQGAAVVGLAVHGACVGFAVVGLAVHGAAVVGLAVVGFAVHGAAVAVEATTVHAEHAHITLGSGQSHSNTELLCTVNDLY
jgi:hypothetical protein